MLLCFFLFVTTTQAAYYASNLTTTEAPPIDNSAKIRELQAKLPAKYLCCKGITNQRINSNLTACEDKRGDFVSNLSIRACPRKHYLTASSAFNGYNGLFVESDIVFLGYIRSRYGYRQAFSPKSLCFYNETNNGTTDLMAILCYQSLTMGEDDEEEEVTSTTKEKSRIAGALSLVSAPFLILVIFVYASIPQLRDVQGKNIICLCCSYLMNSILIANEDLQISKEQRKCQSGGDIIFFTLMASVFWMNAITADTFLSIRYPKQASQWTRQFVWYCFYAWGVPALLLLGAMFADITPGTLVLSGMELRFRCWTYGDAVQWMLYLGPMTVVIGASCVLLLYSAVLVWKLPQLKCVRYKFFLTLKLFVVVGISWLNEPFQKIHGEYNILWVIGDCWNLLQGVLLFVVLVLLRKRAMTAIINNYNFCSTPWLRKYSDLLSEEEEDAVGIIGEEQATCDANAFDN